jgi:ParB/RepB/Spo0J family partition protein
MATLPLSSIVRNPDAIRQVTRDSEDFKSLVASVKSQGVIQAISVRPAPDGSGKYVIIDGDHRFTAAEEAGLTEIKVDIDENCTDEQAYKRQYVANMQRVDTKPVEYGRHLTRILARDPRLTASALAADLGESTSKIMQRLKLADLHPDIGVLVDAGVINLSNAVALSALPEEEQLNFADAAKTMGNSEFKPTVDERVKEINKAKREGRKAEPVKNEFTPVPHIRTLSDIKGAFANPAVISTIPGVTDVGSAQAAIAWALNMDPDTLATKRAAWEKKEADKAATKDRIAKERETKKLADQEKKIADARAKLGSTPATS